MFQPGGCAANKTGTLNTKSVTASQLAQDSPVLPHKLLAPQQPPAAPAKVTTIPLLITVEIKILCPGAARGAAPHHASPRAPSAVRRGPHQPHQRAGHHQALHTEGKYFSVFNEYFLLLSNLRAVTSPARRGWRRCSARARSVGAAAARTRAVSPSGARRACRARGRAAARQTGRTVCRVKTC